MGARTTKHARAHATHTFSPHFLTPDSAPSQPVATVVPTINLSTAPLSQQAASFVITGTGFVSSAYQNMTITYNLGATGGVTYINSTAITASFTTQPNAFSGLTAYVKVNGVNDPAQPLQVATIVPAATVTSFANNLAQGASSFDIVGYVVVVWRVGGVEDTHVRMGRLCRQPTNTHPLPFLSPPSPSAPTSTPTPRATPLS